MRIAGVMAASAAHPLPQAVTQAPAAPAAAPQAPSGARGDAPGGATPSAMAAATTVGPMANATLGGGPSGVHASNDTLIERYLTNGTVQMQGGGQAGAELRAAARGKGGGGGSDTTVYSVPDSLQPVQFNLNDQTASAGNILVTQGGTAEASLESAVAEINGAAGQTLIAPELGTTSQVYASNDQNNIISFTQGNYRFSRNTIAVAISYLDGSNVVGSDVMFNPKMRFSTDDSGSVEQSTFDIQGIATHELMHTLGVPHISSDPNATMYPSASMKDDIKMRTLESADVDALLARYPQA